MKKTLRMLALLLVLLVLLSTSAIAEENEDTCILDAWRCFFSRQKIRIGQRDGSFPDFIRTCFGCVPDFGPTDGNLLRCLFL